MYRYFKNIFVCFLKADPSTLLPGEDDVAAADLRQSFLPTSKEINKSIGNVHLNYIYNHKNINCLVLSTNMLVVFLCP